MADEFVWKRWADHRGTLPPGVAEAVDSARRTLGHDAPAEAVVRALRDQNVGFIAAIMGLMAIKDINAVTRLMNEFLAGEDTWKRRHGWRRLTL